MLLSNIGRRIPSLFGRSTTTVCLSRADNGRPLEGIVDYDLPYDHKNAEIPQFVEMMPQMGGPDRDEYFNPKEAIKTSFYFWGSIALCWMLCRSLEPLNRRERRTRREWPHEGEHIARGGDPDNELYLEYKKQHDAINAAKQRRKRRIQKENEFLELHGVKL